MRAHKFTIGLVGLMMVVASCGDDGGGDAGGEAEAATAESAAPTADSTSTEPTDAAATTAASEELTASWAGVTEDTIRIGFLEIDMESLVEMGLVEDDRGDPKHVIDILVEELNARGGIHGRHVEVTYENVLPVGTTDAEAACLRLTEDADVFAVLGFFAGPATEANPCISDTGETIMIGGSPTPADQARARAPWLSTGMAATRALPAAMGLMHDEGMLVDPVAVVWATEDENAARELVLPELDRLGHDVALEVAQTAPAGDRPAMADEWATIDERMRADGINSIVLVEQSAMVNGTNQLTALGYDGKILVASHGLLGRIGVTAQVPVEDLEGIGGTMGSTREESWDLPATRECIEILEAGDPEITVVPSDEVAEGEFDWAYSLIPNCQRLRFFEMIADAAGPDLTHETFLAAAEGLGEIELPYLPLGSLGPGKLDAADGIRLATFDPTIEPTGDMTPVGDLIRVP